MKPWVIGVILLAAFALVLFGFLRYIWTDAMFNLNARLIVTGVTMFFTTGFLTIFVEDD